MERTGTSWLPGKMPAETDCSEGPAGLPGQGVAPGGVPNSRKCTRAAGWLRRRRSWPGRPQAGRRRSDNRPRRLRRRMRLGARPGSGDRRRPRTVPEK